MFKVVGIDNFNRENISDRLVVQVYLRSREHAQQIADILNEAAGPDSQTYYTVYPSDKPLYIFEP